MTANGLAGAAGRGPVIWFLLAFLLAWIATDGAVLLSPELTLAKNHDAFFSQYEETDLYAPAIVHFSPLDPFKVDYTSGLEGSRPSLLPVLAFAILNAVYRLTGSAEAALAAGHLFVILHFALFYLTLHRLTGRRALACIGGVLATFALDFYDLHLLSAPIVVIAAGAAALAVLLPRSRFLRTRADADAAVVGLALGFAFLAVSIAALGFDVRLELDFSGQRIISPALSTAFFALTLYALAALVSDLSRHDVLNRPAVLGLCLLLPLNLYVYMLNLLILAPTVLAFVPFLLWRHGRLLVRGRNAAAVLAGLLVLLVASVPFLLFIVGDVAAGAPAYLEYVERANIHPVTTLLSPKTLGVAALGLTAALAILSRTRRPDAWVILAPWSVCLLELWFLNSLGDAPLVPQLALLRRNLPFLTVLLLAQAAALLPIGAGSPTPCGRCRWAMMSCARGPTFPSGSGGSTAARYRAT